MATTFIIVGDADMEHLGKVFPELAGKMAKYATTIYIGETLGRTHPQVRKSVRPYVEPKVRFHTYPSPATLFDFLFSGPEERRFTAPEWKNVLRLMKEGSAWEDKHPDLDYGLGSRHGFVARMRLMYPALRVRPSFTGVRVKDLYRAVVQVARPNPALHVKT